MSVCVCECTCVSCCPKHHPGMLEPCNIYNPGPSFLHSLIWHSCILPLLLLKLCVCVCECMHLCVFVLMEHYVAHLGNIVIQTWMFWCVGRGCSSRRGRPHHGDVAVCLCSTTHHEKDEFICCGSVKMFQTTMTARNGYHSILYVTVYYEDDLPMYSWSLIGSTETYPTFTHVMETQY